MGNIKQKQQAYLDTLIERYPILKSCEEDIGEAYCLLRDSYETGGKLLVAGNGGSAADAEHITGELMKSFKKKRALSAEFKCKLEVADSIMGQHLGEVLEQPLPAMALVGHEALSTAFLNDKEGKTVFAQQLLGFGKKGDVFLGISTSGNSRNVLYAAVTAKAMGITVIALTGTSGGRLAGLADTAICVPETETFKVQELHLPVYHCLCLMLEDYFFMR
mgnify:FL=1|jgi:D-sedoheptulose 7-phosphate isomerase